MPTANVSALELTLQVTTPCSQPEVLAALAPIKTSSGLPLLAVCEEPLVSIDFNQHPASAIIDSNYLSVSNSHVKLLAWYDNEWAYAVRLLDTLQLMAQRKNNRVENQTTSGHESVYV